MGESGGHVIQNILLSEGVVVGMGIVLGVHTEAVDEQSTKGSAQKGPIGKAAVQKCRLPLIGLALVQNRTLLH